MTRTIEIVRWAGRGWEVAVSQNIEVIQNCGESDVEIPTIIDAEGWSDDAKSLMPTPPKVRFIRAADLCGDPEALGSLLVTAFGWQYDGRSAMHGGRLTLTAMAPLWFPDRFKVHESIHYMTEQRVDADGAWRHTPTGRRTMTTDEMRKLAMETKSC